MKKFLTCQNIPQNIGESDRKAQAQVGHVQKEKLFTFANSERQSWTNYRLHQIWWRWIKVTVNLPKRK